MVILTGFHGIFSQRTHVGPAKVLNLSMNMYEELRECMSSGLYRNHLLIRKSHGNPYVFLHGVPCDFLHGILIADSQFL